MADQYVMQTRRWTDLRMQQTRRAEQQASTGGPRRRRRPPPTRPHAGWLASHVLDFDRTMFYCCVEHGSEMQLDAFRVIRPLLSQVLTNGVDEVEERQSVVAGRQLLHAPRQHANHLRRLVAVLIGENRQRGDRALVRVDELRHLRCERLSEGRQFLAPAAAAAARCRHGDAAGSDAHCFSLPFRTHAF